MKRHSWKQLLADWGTAVAGTHHAQPPAYKGPDIPLNKITDDTRTVEPGDCFVARVRLRGDGSVWSDAHGYIPQAIEKGARLIIAQQQADEVGVTVPPEVVYFTVPDTAVAIAWLAAAWHGFPSHEMVVIGVTGTDGKSSTSQIIQSLLQSAGLKTGMLSTIKAVIGEEEEPLPLHVTTPEAPLIQHYLRRMVDAGLTHVVLETTSHALALGRVTAVAFDIAVVTNITHEHLDIHGSWENYFAAKKKLFDMIAARELPPSASPHKRALPGTAVLNQDDSSFGRLAAVPTTRHISYAIANAAHLTAADIQHTPGQTHFSLKLDDGRETAVASPLVGEFNIYNMLAASGTAVALGLSLAQIAAGLKNVPPISGRMERIDRGQPFQVIVDFAHTPISLEKAISVARQMTKGRVIAVFGSAGQRDVEKRRIMAEISARDADLTILTAEDPRTESLDEILDYMAVGARNEGGIEGETFWRVSDRGRAIYFAFSNAQPGDLVLICGKGHEQSMCFGKTEFPWDDRAAARAALDAFLAGQPMVDLGLPTFAEVNG